MYTIYKRDCGPRVDTPVLHGDELQTGKYLDKINITLLRLILV